MRRREYIAKFIGDLAKIVFATAIIGEILQGTPNLLRIVMATIFMLVFFALSVVILPRNFDSE